MDFLNFMKISSKIKKGKNKHFKSKSDSFFHLTFSDKSTLDENEIDWSQISSDVIVNHFGRYRLLKVLNHPVDKIKIHHEEQELNLDVEKDEKVYQSILMQTIFLQDGHKVEKCLGRIVGKIKDGKIIEEHLVNAQTGEITGLKF